MDPETQKVAQAQKPFYDLVKSQGWTMAREKLDALIAENTSVLGVEGKNAEEVFKEVAAKQFGVEMLKVWISEIEGIAEMYKENIEEPETAKKLETIKRV